MGSQNRQFMGFSLGIIGFLGTIIICALPMWRVAEFIGINIVTVQILWEGLWMNCVMQSTGQMQCKIYDPLLILPKDLQAARVLVVTAIIICIFAVLLVIICGKKFVEDETFKAQVELVSGLSFFVAGVLVFISVYWTSFAIIQDFYNPILTNAQSRELGLALHIGRVSGAFLLLGGFLICCNYLA